MRRRAASGRQPLRELRAGTIHTASLRMDTVRSGANSPAPPRIPLPPARRLPVYAQLSRSVRPHADGGGYSAGFAS
jgi:hypothetical protein